MMQAGECSGFAHNPATKQGVTGAVRCGFCIPPGPTPDTLCARTLSLLLELQVFPTLNTKLLNVRLVNDFACHPLCSGAVALFNESKKRCLAFSEEHASRHKLLQHSKSGTALYHGLDNLEHMQVMAGTTTCEALRRTGCEQHRVHALAHLLFKNDSSPGDAPAARSGQRWRRCR